MHTYILTPTCIRIHMHTNTHAHALHCPHAEVPILRPTIYAQICIRIHIHTCINAYIYMYIHTCTYIYLYMSTHIHTYTYIHTHLQIVYIHARRHFWTDSAVATTRKAQLDVEKLPPSPCPLQSRGGLPFVASSPIASHEKWRISAEQPQPTVAHHTITIARCPDYMMWKMFINNRKS